MMHAHNYVGIEGVMFNYVQSSGAIATECRAPLFQKVHPQHHYDDPYRHVAQCHQ